MILKKQKDLAARIRAFVKKYGYHRYNIDFDGELMMYDRKGEPFGYTEYKDGPMKREWKLLERKLGALLR